MWVWILLIVTNLFAFNAWANVFKDYVERYQDQGYKIEEKIVTGADGNQYVLMQKDNKFILITGDSTSAGSTNYSRDEIAAYITHPEKIQNNHFKQVFSTIKNAYSSGQVTQISAYYSKSSTNPDVYYSLDLKKDSPTTVTKPAAAVAKAAPSPKARITATKNATQPSPVVERDDLAGTNTIRALDTLKMSLNKDSKAAEQEKNLDDFFRNHFPTAISSDSDFTTAYNAFKKNGDLDEFQNTISKIRDKNIAKNMRELRSKDIKPERAKELNKLNDQLLTLVSLQENPYADKLSKTIISSNKLTLLANSRPSNDTNLFTSCTWIGDKSYEVSTPGCSTKETKVRFGEAKCKIKIGDDPNAIESEVTTTITCPADKEDALKCAQDSSIRPDEVAYNPKTGSPYQPGEQHSESSGKAAQ